MNWIISFLFKDLCWVPLLKHYETISEIQNCINSAESLNSVTNSDVAYTDGAAMRFKLEYKCTFAVDFFFLVHSLRRMSDVYVA